MTPNERIVTNTRQGQRATRSVARGIGITWRVGVGRVAPATIVVLYARDVGFPETTLAILGGFKAVIIVIIADC